MEDNTKNDKQYNTNTDKGYEENTETDKQNMGDVELRSALASILFAFGDPITPREIQRAFDGVSTARIKSSLNLMMKEEYNGENGIKIIKLQDAFQMCTSEGNEPYIVKLFDKSRKKPLSNAMMETLTIIAYMQPVTRIEIEDIRGVKCDNVIRRLLDYRLIAEAGRLEKIGKPIIYRTTDEFLKLMEIESVSELPNIELKEEEDENSNE